MFDFHFITKQEAYDNLDKPYLITINMANGQQATLGRDTEEGANETVGFIYEAMCDGNNFFSTGYAIIRLDSVSSIALTHQN